MGKFKKVTTRSINSEQGTFGVIEASRYNGLPVANEYNVGIVKLDGVTIKLNANGEIESQVVFEDERMNQHTNNNLIHVSDKDRKNLEILNLHISNKNIHFTSGEKEKLEKAYKHSETEHLTSDKIKSINDHMGDSNVHFDNVEQKDSFLNAMKGSVNKKQGSSFKILITDQSGNVVLSEVDSTVLDNIKELKDPIMSLLARYASKDHEHDNMLTTEKLESHTKNNEVHFADSEKSELVDKVENLSGSVNAMGESLGGVYNRLNRMNSIYTQNKLKIRYIRDNLFNRISKDPKSLSWVNCAIYKDGKNIALTLPITSIITDSGMSVSDEQKLAYLNGNVVDVAFTQADCSGQKGHYFQIDLGSVTNEITHIEVRHKLGDSYETLMEVSEDGENWIPLYDTSINPMYEEDKYGKSHIINFEAYMNLFARA